MSEMHCCVDIKDASNFIGIGLSLSISSRVAKLETGFHMIKKHTENDTYWHY